MALNEFWKEKIMLIKVLDYEKFPDYQPFIN
jgi:hypothetical protein